MLSEGCCPEALLPSYEPEKPAPTNVYFGKDPDAKYPVCEREKVGNPISIYSGNNFESQTDLSFPSAVGNPFVFKRHYNSQAGFNVSMGYGWLHSYEVFVNPSVSYSGSVYLSILDETGRSVYFTDQGGGLYSGAFKERSYVQMESGNYVWYRLDGRRFVFNATYKLIRIEEPSGNRRTLTYDANNRLASVADEAGERSITFHYNSAGRIDYISGPVTAAVPDGIWVHYGYDASGNLVSATYADGSGYNYEYVNPANHNLNAKKDKQGHLLSSWNYDNQDRVFKNFTRDGKGVSINYVSDNEVRVTDAYGTVRTYAIWDIDGRKKVTDISGPSGCADCGDEVKRIEYDSQGRVIEVEYAGGLINQYADFDSRGNARIVKQAVGTPDEKTTTYTFHPDLAAKLSHTEPSIIATGSKVTIWDYDSDGNETPNENPTRRVYRLIERGFTRDAAGQVVPFDRISAYTYNSKGQVLTIDGPLSGSQDTVAFSYNVFSGDLLAVTRPLTGDVSYSDYDGAGQVGRIIDENGSATVLTYDGKGRIKTVTSESDNSTTTYTYNTAGEPQQVTAANGITTDFEYDATYGRLIRMLDPIGNYLQYGYDGQGNRSEESIYNPSAERTFWKRFDYQSPQHPGKLWKEINPDSTYTEYSYDAGGNIQAVTDPAAKTTFYNYDSLNRLITVTQPGDVITAYGYDPNDNLAIVTDAENHATTYTYDDLGRLVLSTSPDTNTAAYAYDSAGNLISKTDANGITTTYTYDTLNRLTGILFPDASQNISYTYDEGTAGKGRLTGMSDPSGDTVYVYDPKGNLITETKTIAGVVYTTAYSYDAAGMLTGMTYPDGRTVSYELDPAGRVVRVTTVKDGVSKILTENIGYLPFGPQAGLTYGSGLVQTGAFDLLYRPANIAAGSVQNIDYTKDPAGNITAISDNVDPSKSQSFGYDDLYRLTSAAGAYGTIGYTYDKIGNRLTETVNGQTDTYAYAAGASRLIQITGANPRSFTLDLNGNTTSAGSKTFTFNQNNRLIRAAENSALLAAYTYNGSGQRVIKQSQRETTVYLYDRQGNLMAETENDGTLIAEYFHLNGRRLAAIRADHKIEAVIDIDPDTLNLNSDGNWVTAFIELPDGYDINAIDPYSITLNKTVSIVRFGKGDHDGDGIPDLMIKFDRTQVCDILPVGDAVEITIEGVGDGFKFFGVDFIRIIDKGGYKKNKSGLRYGLVAETTDDTLGLLSAERDIDPAPVAFGSIHLKPKPVLLASLFDITGILARSVVAQIPEDKIYYYINDHLGTPQVMTDENGEVVWQADYLPFGEVNVAVNAVGNGFRFPGQYYNDETGLHYNYHRYYDPKTGRYLTPDPIGLAGMDPNLYGYVLNNPVNWIDPMGLEAMIRAAKNNGLIGKLKTKLYTDYYFFVNDDYQRANIAGEYAFYAMTGALVIEATAVEGYLAYTAYGPELNLAFREALISYLPGVPDATIAGFFAWLTSVADDYIDFSYLKDKTLEILYGPNPKSDPCQK